MLFNIIDFRTEIINLVSSGYGPVDCPSVPVVIEWI
jgi:hypothetical protein